MDISSAVNPALSYGANGILGLGFTSLSTIDALVNQTGGATGRSLLYNAFAANTSEPNFIAFALERSSAAGTDDAVQGSFAIGEFEPAYAAVNDTPKIPTWPVVSPTRWNVLVEAVIVNQTIITLGTNVTGAPSNRAVTLLDSGTSYTSVALARGIGVRLTRVGRYASEDLCNSIYGGIAGAHYDATLGQWVVPCNVEVDMAVQIGYARFRMNVVLMLICIGVARSRYTRST
jgi:saccharopepsin